MLFVSRIKTGRVDIEGVGIFHDELPHAQQSGLGTRLIAKLGLYLIPDLRQLLIAAQLTARNRGHYFFVRHAQTEIAVEAVFEAEHVRSHHVPAAGSSISWPPIASISSRTIAMILLSERWDRNRWL